MKSVYPGVSKKLILCFFHSTGANAVLSEIFRRISSSSKSVTVFPSETAPRRLIALPWKSTASVNVVFPELP